MILIICKIFFIEQSYDAVLEKFRATMENLHGPSPPKHARMHGGAEVARQELDALNKRYRELVATVTQRVDNISAVGKRENVSRYYYIFHSSFPHLFLLHYNICIVS